MEIFLGQCKRMNFPYLEYRKFLQCFSFICRTNQHMTDHLNHFLLEIGHNEPNVAIQQYCDAVIKQMCGQMHVYIVLLF
ncbi:hypothetical protein T12_8545 [Trichinella patagoniensis]|uniref:Uncharacterized protein n=1 Tax=Trichinella patagoniensis TaxID=990121 RepID=A0A0V1ABZ2_9BILA|nr:hypothetical protein T12_8545 [Trichinella patagoniensis]